METKIIIESLKKTIIELRDEKYQQEKNGLAHSALEFVKMIEFKLPTENTKEDYCQCISTVGVSGEPYGKHTCDSCGKEVPNKNRRY
ncbi:hypothetical protein [Wenyingzhuangia sp. 2_MG-2023]|uniref:hypothetical protein n=1 Tax=Wenyingzhuangia sp. 2_MG-2023 TaxID=3062639 RepID=UPI0026E353DD|nr:hypothetical protein [Wenyingzhuangia sp. 2_MG-2023]MDO6737119.1 hypothetical protein [Wenyingzhuangia sp. 2_MG-2023]